MSPLDHLQRRLTKEDPDIKGVDEDTGLEAKSNFLEQ